MIREGRISDAKQISKIKVDSWKETYKNLIPEEVLEELTYEKEEKNFIEKFDKRRIIVYEENNEILGYSFLEKRKSSNEEESKKTSEIYAIYTKNGFKQKGIGTTMIAHICSLLKEEKNENVLLWCLNGNEDAKCFYKNRGFIPFDNQTKILRGKNVEEVSFIKKLL